jgi:5-methylcytosine-specific restriction protein A
MFEALMEKSEITVAQQFFLKRLKTDLPQHGPGVFSFRGGDEKAVLYYNNDFWFANPHDLPNRYWNVFGAGIPCGQNDITLEFNIPFEGISKQIQGLYAKEPKTGEVFLLHRGKIGGGRSGIGKDAFLEWLNPPLIDVADDKAGKKDWKPSRVICVTSLSSPNFLDRIASFVRSVAKFKAATGSRSLLRT